MTTLKDLQKQRQLQLSDDEHNFEDNSPVQVPIVQLDFGTSSLIGEEEGEFIEVKRKKDRPQETSWLKID